MVNHKKFNEDVIQKLKQNCVHTKIPDNKQMNQIISISGIYGENFEHEPSINERNKIRMIAKKIFNDLMSHNEIYRENGSDQRIKLYFDSIIDNINKLITKDFDFERWIEIFLRCSNCPRNLGKMTCYFFSPSEIYISANQESNEKDESQDNQQYDDDDDRTKQQQNPKFSNNDEDQIENYNNMIMIFENFKNEINYQIQKNFEKFSSKFKNDFVENNQIDDEDEKDSYQTFIFGIIIFLANSIPNLIIIILVYHLIKKINGKIEKLIIKFENNNIINESFNPLPSPIIEIDSQNENLSETTKLSNNRKISVISKFLLVLTLKMILKVIERNRKQSKFSYLSSNKQHPNCKQYLKIINNNIDNIQLLETFLLSK
ncbi:hypothetical protein DERF_006555 [Dermatophagoides farinae]|uniref:Uncharacterized protein n=1 Tax=Dermatophagoides farinae TaxID=6954 RepID=A0A922L9S1_DERFA|nr:hypothetical protein DERF_006555 [Dermatophagoides farinae]